jgi:hypothetical protein
MLNSSGLMHSLHLALGWVIFGPWRRRSRCSAAAGSVPGLLLYRSASSSSRLCSRLCKRSAWNVTSQHNSALREPASLPCGRHRQYWDGAGCATGMHAENDSTWQHLLTWVIYHKHCGTTLDIQPGCSAVLSTYDNLQAILAALHSPTASAPAHSQKAHATRALFAAASACPRPG